MKKRTLYLALLSFATIAAVCYGSWTYLGRPSVTLTKNQFSFTFKRPDDTTIQKKTGAFDSIRLHLRAADLELKTGEDYCVTYQGPKQACPAFTVKDGVLTAAEPSPEKNSLSSASRQTVTVTVPQDLTQLKDLSLFSNNGDLTIDPGHTVTMNTLTLGSENGDLALYDCRGKMLTAKASNGDVDLETILFSNSDLESGNGDISLTTADSLGNYTISADSGSGDISIGKNSYSLDDDDHSSISVGKGPQTISLSTDNGDIDVSGR